MADNRKILLVEDEQIIQVLCRRLLNQTAYALDIVGSVQEAFKRIQSNPPDLLLTDLRLPDGDGIEVIRFLREISPKAKIIIITGSPTPEDRLGRLKDLKADDYISKPFEVDVLISAVQKALGS
jgi:CheY-like chemotaxis protein